MTSNIFLFFIFSFSIFLFSCTDKTQKETALPYRNLSDSAHYVGINTCRTCHENIYETFIKTGMGQSFDHATLTKTSAKFDSHTVIYDKAKDFYYHPYWKNDSLFIKEFRLEGKDTTFSRVEKISYIIGSGQHTNSHMVYVNGYLTQAPMTYYTQKGTWDLPPGFENGRNSRFSRTIELECQSCHNSYPKIIEGSINKYESLPTGINCERCHGPGSIHVAEKSSGKLVDISKAIDYSIVNPAKLPINYQFEICQRCHLQGNTILREGKSFYDFKPGMMLSQVLNVFMPKYKGKEDEFIMASHVERLKMSKCFINTMKKLENGKLPIKDKLRPYKDGMTCVTCHNPHVSVKVTGPEVFNNACKNCHFPGSDNHICTRNKVDKSIKDISELMTGDCVSCHMPKSNTIDIPHVISTDHFIRKPVRPQDVKQIKEFIGLGCINDPKTDSKTFAKAYINYFEKFDPNPVYLDSALLRLKSGGETDLKNIHELIHIYYLKNNWKKITEIVEKIGDKSILNGQKKSFDNSDSWTDYRITEAYFSIGNLNRAAFFNEIATKLAPYQLEFRNKYGSILMQLGQVPQAIEQFEFVVNENPKHATAWSNLGFAYLKSSGEIEKANNCYDKALALDPDLEIGLLNKAGLLIYTNKLVEARKILLHLIKKYPKNEQASAILRQI